MEQENFYLPKFSNKNIEIKKEVHKYYFPDQSPSLK